jgi:hypothetical protein
MCHLATIVSTATVGVPDVESPILREKPQESGHAISTKEAE